MEQGYRYVRAQMAVPGYSTYGAQSAARTGRSAGTLNVVQEPWEPTAYTAIVPKLFEHLRSTVGWEVELLHDIHERIPPIQAIGLAKELEQYKLFFLEDPFSPEDIDYFPLMRQQTSTPIAMGELFVNQAEYVPLNNIRDGQARFGQRCITSPSGFTTSVRLSNSGKALVIQTSRARSAACSRSLGVLLLSAMLS
jgi:mannonate dehydratase